MQAMLSVYTFTRWNAAYNRRCEQVEPTLSYPVKTFPQMKVIGRSRTRRRMDSCRLTFAFTAAVEWQHQMANLKRSLSRIAVLHLIGVTVAGAAGCEVGKFLHRAPPWVRVR